VSPNPRSRQRLLATTVALGAVAALIVPAIGPATAEVDGPPTVRPMPATAAERALDVAGDVMAGRSQALSPTIALRDLAMRVDGLTGRDRAVAETLLARPNQGLRGGDGFAAWRTREAAASRNDLGCSADIDTPVCIHWTNRGTDAPNPADSDNDNVPNWVETTRAEMEQVWDYEVGTLGYRPPMTDQRGSKDDDGVYFDVYLSDIGNRYYGYCTLDDSRNRRNYNFKDRSGYCVLDDDYARSQFGFHTPLENLQVTAAHEFFHAIQFAYDASEDAWFMEGGAAWIEDEVYDNVNDNRQYLASSQFRHPRQALDNNRGIGVYGTWGFLRYLSERIDPAVIRKAWVRADGARGGPDDYSLQALTRAVKSRGRSMPKLVGDFGLALSEPEAFLSEGDRFPSSSVDTFSLNGRGDSTHWRRYTLDHLSFAPVRLRAGDRVRANDRLHITVDAPGLRTHPAARVMVVRQGGGYGPVQTIHLNRRGAGSIGVGIGDADVKRVVLALGNTSTDFRRCFSRTTPYSCHGGIPLDDDLHYWFKAVVS